MTDNPYEQIQKLPIYNPNIPDTYHLNHMAPERPHPGTAPGTPLEEFSSHFPMEFPPQKIRSEADFPGR